LAAAGIILASEFVAAQVALGLFAGGCRMKLHISRRQLFRTSVAASGMALFSQPLPAADAAPSTKKRTLRLAHLTDLHIQPERAAVQGVAAALHHVQALADKPELIITGGDTIMDALVVGMDRAKLQWDLWQQTIKDECSLPIESCLGNHDVFGWDKKASGTTGEEAQWGKRWACDVFGRAKPYYSFDRNDWHIIVLDSILPSEQRLYNAGLDDEQFAWLQSDLAATPATTPVLVVSHIPIITVTVFSATAKKTDNGDLVIAGPLMHNDYPRLRELFRKHPNVKLCLSGHTHVVDRIDFYGVGYLCNGAVCGGWWKADHQHTQPGYAVIDLFDDGTFDHQYINYGWKYQA
jgi:3',5'-cyclic AMP phosphodiesterase CpdA